MKLGRMVYDDKISVPFEDEINRLVEEHTLPKRMVKIDIKPTYLAISQKISIQLFEIAHQGALW